MIELERFGQVFMIGARHETIESWRDVIDGSPTASWRAELHRRIQATMTIGQLELVRSMIPLIVDETVHNVLWVIQDTPWLDLAASTDSGSNVSIKDASDDSLANSGRKTVRFADSVRRATRGWTLWTDGCVRVIGRARRPSVAGLLDGFPRIGLYWQIESAGSGSIARSVRRFRVSRVGLDARGPQRRS